MCISVIVPLYNAENYIAKLVSNILKVDIADIEFIFVNDGASDNTKDLCEEAKEKMPNLTVIHKPNGGVSSARNAGLDVARGENICFADCDDTPKADMYSVLSSVADHTACDMVLGGYEKVDADGNASEVKLPYCGQVDTKTIAYSMAFWSGFVDGRPIKMLYGSVWPNLYRKSIIDKYGIRFLQGIVLGEDLLFNLDYLSHCQNVQIVNQSLYRYSVGNESATRKRIPDLWERYKLLLQHCEDSLAKTYGYSKELSKNIAHQYMNDAISVIEEQIIPFEGANTKAEIRRICKDLNDKSISGTLIKKGTVKEKAEAVLFRFRMTELIIRWLG